ncbi:hypothetical protein, partial [Aneurinibacillus tyrosinisolvens]|uniref:hypothetical protein n=1 Tax=Aneurinibacillus tyrosinisolvens TaxID=1443435 RepID=UPI001F40CEB3
VMLPDKNLTRTHSKFHCSVFKELLFQRHPLVHAATFISYQITRQIATTYLLLFFAGHLKDSHFISLSFNWRP